MKKQSKIIELFFNEPSRRWHFEEILKEAKISRPQAAYWLQKAREEKVIIKIKPRGKMPHYIANYENPAYQIKKRLFALEMLEKAGFLSHLNSLPKAKTVILFGSISRWDWHKDSDVDVFIYGNPAGLETHKYRVALHREIEMFICEDKEGLKRFNPALLHNVVEGYLIKGSLDFMQVVA